MSSFYFGLRLTLVFTIIQISKQVRQYNFIAPILEVHKPQVTGCLR
uniref:Uncharacterized protein n=1 Tax=Arundo donax TaxID=35708 RepID=A0A0A9AAL7_ARUDO